MNQFLLSIIIPMYNVEQYLADCLDSLIIKEHSDWEIIIVNDGSIDNSMDVARYMLINIRIFEYLFKKIKDYPLLEIEV